MKHRVYTVMWEGDEEGGEGHRQTGRGVREETKRVEYGRGVPSRATPAGQGREQSVTSNDSRPSTCGAGSVEGDEAEQKRRAAWLWKRGEDILEGARERTGDMVVVEEMEGRETDSLWGVL